MCHFIVSYYDKINNGLLSLVSCRFFMQGFVLFVTTLLQKRRYERLGKRSWNHVDQGGTRLWNLLWFLRNNDKVRNMLTLF